MVTLTRVLGQRADLAVSAEYGKGLSDDRYWSKIPGRRT